MAMITFLLGKIVLGATLAKSTNKVLMCVSHPMSGHVFQFVPEVSGFSQRQQVFAFHLLHECHQRLHEVIYTYGWVAA
jgi:hypothetical protein